MVVTREAGILWINSRSGRYIWWNDISSSECSGFVKHIPVCWLNQTEGWVEGGKRQKFSKVESKQIKQLRKYSKKGMLAVKEEWPVFAHDTGIPVQQV